MGAIVQHWIILKWLDGCRDFPGEIRIAKLPSEGGGTFTIREWLERGDLYDGSLVNHIKVRQPDGSVKIISKKRVKIDRPEPRAKKGFRPEKFENSIPGSKGKKRLPTKSELDLLNKYTQ